ncbi:MAG: DGC domain protein [Methanocella sp. PtaU1.Bin125]|nr:MAG: DGC domain protein [Methanocella sp. PtaU1.Bin125]
MEDALNEWNDGNIAILTCSSPSNAGRIAIQAAVTLLHYKPGRVIWAEARRPLGEIEAVARSADKILVIDGCPTSCVVKKLGEMGLKADGRIIVTDLLGIQKSMAEVRGEQVDQVIEAIGRLLAM